MVERRAIRRREDWALYLPVAIPPEAPAFTPGTGEFVPGAVAFVPGATAFVPGAGSVVPSAGAAPDVDVLADSGLDVSARVVGSPAPSDGRPEEPEEDADDDLAFQFDEELVNTARESSALQREKVRLLQSEGAVGDTDSEMGDIDVDKIMILIERSPDRPRKSHDDRGVKEPKGKGLAHERTGFHKPRSEQKLDWSEDITTQLDMYALVSPHPLLLPPVPPGDMIALVDPFFEAARAPVRRPTLAPPVIGGGGGGAPRPRADAGGGAVPITHRTAAPVG